MGVKSHPTKEAADDSAIAKKTRKHRPVSRKINTARTDTHADMHAHLLSRSEPKMARRPLSGCRKEGSKNRTGNRYGNSTDTEGKNETWSLVLRTLGHPLLTHHGSK